MIIKRNNAGTNKVDAMFKKSIKNCNILYSPLGVAVATLSFFI